MKFREWRYLIFADFFRIHGRVSYPGILKEVLFGEGYKYLFWMRSCRYVSSHSILKIFFLPVCLLFRRRVGYKLGIAIPTSTVIGSGFIRHFGGIVVSGKAIIGRNCNISQGVTIGKVNRGARAGFPVLGDGVYVGPGAKVIGKIKIGSNVAIGANCVVTKSVPDDSVVVGIPGKVVSMNGAASYVNNTNYDDEIWVKKQEVV